MTQNAITMNHDAQCHINESWHTQQQIPYQCVMAHIATHATLMSQGNNHESWRTMSYQWVMAHTATKVTSMSHGTQYQSVMTHNVTSMSDVELNFQILISTRKRKKNSIHTSDPQLSRFLLHKQIKKMKNLPVTLQMLIWLKNKSPAALQVHSCCQKAELRGQGKSILLFFYYF